MKNNSKLALALLVCGAHWGLAAQKAHAEPLPAVYIVNEVEVLDQAAFQTYAERQSALVKKNGGRYIIRRGRVTGMEGTPPKGYTVYVFESADKMKTWQDDPEQKDLKAIRDKAAKFRTFAVEGVAN